MDDTRGAKAGANGGPHGNTRVRRTLSRLNPWSDPLKSFETRITCRPYELDSFGHINHSVYLNYFEQARWDALAAGGFSHDALQARGWEVHVVRIEVDFRSEVRLGDELRIKTWVDRHRRSATIILQEAWRDPQEEGSAADLVAEARVVAVWIGEGRQPIRVPEEIKKALGDPARR